VASIALIVLSKTYSTYAEASYDMADVILYIVDQHSISSILNTPISQILTMLNSQIFQKNRPPIYNNFHRDFDVDLEGDLLELFDSNPYMKVTNQSPSVYESELKSD